MPWSTERRIAIGAASLLSALVVAQVLLYLNANSLVESLHWSTHTQEVLRTLASNHLAIREAESEQRSYLITGDPVRLVSFHSAIDQGAAQLELLQQLVADNPVQSSSLRELRELIEKRRSLLRQAIQTRDNQGMESAVVLVRGDQGRIAMEKVGGVIARMEAEERRLLADRVKTEHAADRAQSILFGVVTVFEVALIIMAGWMMCRQSRRRAQAQQRVNIELEERLAAVVESSEDAIISMNLNGNINTWNAGAQHIFGYTAEEAIGRSALFLMDDEVREKALARHQRMRHGERVESCETTYLTKAGHRVDVSVVVSPVRDARGELIGLSEIVRDITSHMRLERALRDSEGRLRAKVAELEALFSVIPIGVGVADDAQCHVIQMNPALARILDLPLEANASKSAPDFERPKFKLFLNDQEMPNSELPMQKAALTGATIVNMAYEMRHADGRVVPLLANAAPLFDDAGNTRGSVGVIWDMTEVRQAEALKVAKEAAEAANQAKDDFLATISHDLRTPIGAILLCAEVLKRTDSPADRRHAIDQIEECARAQSRLIEDILDATRILHGKLRIDMQPLNLQRVVESSVAAVQSMARQYDIQLIVDPCASDAGELQVLGDAIRLEQVCWNLLSNAIKFSPRDSEVRLRTGREGANVWVEVVDHGKGIETEHLPRVFDRLFQGTSPGRFRSSGLGLGLNIVRHVIEMHGGTVEAQSDGPGKGAIFRFTLPRCESAAYAPQAPVAPGEAHEREFPCLRGIKVLVVDADTEARESISLLLGLCGAKTRAASSAAEGWAILQEWMPQVLLSDPDLQPDNGQSLIEKVRTSRNGISRTPAIALCQRDCAPGQAAAIFDRYLLKSIDPAKLASIVARLCNGVSGGNAQAAPIDKAGMIH